MTKTKKNQSEGQMDMDQISALMEKLENISAGENAARELWKTVKDLDALFDTLDPEKALVMDDKISAALKEGQEEEEAIQSIFTSLAGMEAVPYPELVAGF
jgi:ribosomal protein S12 methylthiotransferase accessory factor YcaO